MSVTHKIAPKGDTILVVTNPNASFSRQRPQTKSQMTPTKRSVTQKCVFLSPPHISSSSLPTSTGRYLETGKKLHRYVQQGLLRLKRVIGTPRPCCCSYGSSIADYQICPRQSLRSYWLSFACTLVDYYECHSILDFVSERWYQSQYVGTSSVNINLVHLISNGTLEATLKLYWEA